MSPQPRTSRTIALSIGSFALVAALVAGAFSLQLIPTRAPDLTSTPQAGEAPALVFAEFGQTADRLYVARAETPGERTLIDTIDHAEGWGLNPAVGMSGSLIAYTVLPPDSAPRRDALAELWLLDIDTRNRTRLASDADLLVAPLFTRGGGELVYRSTGAGSEQALVRVDLATRARATVYEEQTAFGIFPIGFDASNLLLFARLSANGTDVYRVTGKGAASLVFHASDNLARDWRISPDGRALSYLAPEVLAERVVHRAQVVPLQGRLEPAAFAAGSLPMEQYGPVWAADGSSLTVGQEAFPGEGAPAAVLTRAGQAAELAAPERGFDVPLQWSADGAYLAVRAFDGVNSHDPGLESLTVVTRDGRRIPVPASAELIFIGWIGRA
ncbi:MAG: hypothetical protein GEU80_00250 [Dehalococcoidia bacterium]|nr:hypothetical protein [Dehalococcoidia bacterium]